jgi:hypothetical protein
MFNKVCTSTGRLAAEEEVKTKRLTLGSLYAALMAIMALSTAIGMTFSGSGSMLTTDATWMKAETPVGSQNG